MPVQGRSWRQPASHIDGHGTANDHRPGNGPYLWNCAPEVGWFIARALGCNKLANGDSSQSYLELTFVSDPLFPVITSSSNAALVLNKFFSYTITADAPTTSLDYLGLNGTLNGSLPSGLSLDPETGTISGLYWPLGRPHFSQSGRKGIETVKKEPPPKIQLLALGEGENGTGTAPLNFFSSLHDFEIEALKDANIEGNKLCNLHR